jgi:hypothetical protein
MFTQNQVDEGTTYGSTERLTTLAEATPAMATTAAVENFMFEWFGW